MALCTPRQPDAYTHNTQMVAHCRAAVQEGATELHITGSLKKLPFSYFTDLLSSLKVSIRNCMKALPVELITCALL